MTPMMEAIDLGRTIKGRKIVSGVNLRLIPGETLGLIGPNGSGKSTLLGMLAGLIVPTTGTVLLDGATMARMTRRDIARRLALVTQAADTADHITVRGAVELGRTPWLGPLKPWSNRDEDAVDTALRAVCMMEMADRDWVSLSGGEKQRVHIARAHAQKPGVLLLDEPTNHLDIHHQIAILDLVETLGITSIIALHDMHHALRCDRILVMKDGICTAIGAPSEVLTPTLIRETFAVEATLLRNPKGGRNLFAFDRVI